MTPRNQAVVTISLEHETLRKADERRKMFKMKRSAYIAHLIERDYSEGRMKIVIVAEPPPPSPTEQ